MAQKPELTCHICENTNGNECITLEHNGHVFQGIKDIADIARKTVSEAICKLKTKQQSSTRAKEVISSSKMVKIQNDTTKFISDVHCLSHSIKEIIEEVVKNEATYADDFLELEKNKMECFLETLDKSVDARDSIINKLENTLLETHDVTFYFNQEKILREFYGSESDDIPILEDIKDLQQFESEDFIDKVVEKIQIKHDIR
ncbi:Hypothetical predicted protein [Mytilus galloprovincialis]|uniref:Uncharacterized protein n=1 Tax=Mytilus galloprovincialis TaxID=29158 RepID=A0A8B6H0U6_MYTGA|nr:Hypothetical predicted protein [Mytilus galloprovincialis]